MVERGLRTDWSEVTARLRSLEPGEMISVECPVGMTMARLRSTVLTTARRMRRDGWRVSTRARGRRLECFLVPEGDVDGRP